MFALWYAASEDSPTAGVWSQRQLPEAQGESEGAETAAADE